MSNILNTVILTQMSPTEYAPSDPGGPIYIGAIDYPSTVYQGYIGSTNYTYEPRANGYGIIDNSKMFIPVAKSPKTQEFKELNKRAFAIQNILGGECSIPSFFESSEDKVQHCTSNFGKFMFKIALMLNTIVSLFFMNKLSPLFIAGFIFFHLVLYKVLTTLYVKVSVAEWKTVKKYKYFIKTDEDYTEFDTPMKQLEEINQYISDQIVNRNKFISLVLILSILFCWFPLMFKK